MKTTLSLLLDTLGVEYTPFYLQKLSKIYNEAQSLSDISSVLWHYKIESLAVQSGIEELSEIPLPALALVSDSVAEQEYFILKEVSQEEVLAITPKGEQKSYSLSEFEKIWSGYTLLLDKNEATKEPSYEKHYAVQQKKQYFDRIKLALQMVLGLAFLVLVGMNLLSLEWNVWQKGAFAAFGILNSLGLGLSGILLSGEIFKDNPVFKKACGMLGKESSCSDLTNQNDKDGFVLKLKNYVSFSEIGVFYFLGSILLSVMALFQKNALYLVFQSGLAVLGIFVVLSSLYYQKFILKKWCALCVSVMAVLLLESMVGTSFFAFSETDFLLFSNSELISIFLLGFVAYLVPVITWNALKPTLLSYQKNNRENKGLSSFKYNAETFRTLLQNQAKIDVSQVPNQLEEGTAESDISLVVVSRPTCPPCKRAKTDLQELVKNYGSHFKMTTCHIAAHQETEDYHQILDLLSDLPYSQKEKEHIISKHYAWAKQVQIDYTPTIILNGYVLP